MTWHRLRMGNAVVWSVVLVIGALLLRSDGGSVRFWVSAVVIAGAVGSDAPLVRTVPKEHRAPGRGTYGAHR